jgi:hypothetical protein
MGRMINVVGTPTPTKEAENLRRLQEISSQMVQRVAWVQTTLLETYLREYMTVNGVAEKELKTVISVERVIEDSKVQVVSIGENRVLMSITYKTDIFSYTEGVVSWFEIGGEYLTHRESYPITTALLADINNQHNETGI